MTVKARISRAIRDTPIRHKLAGIIGVTCGVGVIIAGGAVFAFQTLTLRSTFERDLAALAEIVANNLSGPVAFGDRKAGLEVLASLRAKPQISSATVVANNGESFVSIGPPAAGSPLAPAGRVQTRFSGWALHIAAPVNAEGDASHTLLLVADFRGTFSGFLSLFLLVIGGICAAALGIAIVVGYGLQGLVTRPVLRLSHAARRIGQQQDYGVRVEKLGDDELGVLTDAFNNMLECLQVSDTGLRHANTALQTEIDQRQRLQSELVEASRLAGMAEVATGVLHNVGNVLNSVNVSAGLLREQLQTSRLGTLRRTAELMRGHDGDLGAFLAADPKGRRIPELILRIAEQLTAEHARMNEELLGLSKNIEHIKEIVAVQQTYAKACAVIEQVDLAPLVEQAISIQRSVLERHAVQVVREFPSHLPPVPTDRHKILQILTNFVANAIHAVKVNPENQRRITITIRFQRDHEVVLSVADNGEGIPPENMGKIFRQGFTTRKEGHGFGLHSGVLIVKSLGGSLEAHSPGPGQGATFTLRLPLRSEAAKHAA